MSGSTTGTTPSTPSAVDAMLSARSVAIVGASCRPGSFGARMVTEVARADGLHVDLVNPRYPQIAGRRTVPSLADLPSAPDLVLLGVGDDGLVEQLSRAAAVGARSAVIFGSAVGPQLRDRLRAIAVDAGMAVCGAGCMGFINTATGLRATGYQEPDHIPQGPISLITHSGSVFSAMLRTRRALGFTLVVSSGQELVTSTADYVEHLLERTDTRLIALVSETVRDSTRLRAALHRAAEADVPVVVLPVGGSPLGSSMVAAHSGAVAGDGAMWEALCADTGMLRVGDLGELSDTLELFALARRPGRWATPAAVRRGLATVHDSGAERTLLVDLAHQLDVPLAHIAPATEQRLAALLDDGLDATNPLDVWGTGADTRTLFAGCLAAMQDDPAVGVTALAVDLVPEFDGDTSYADAVLDTAERGDAPLAVLANLGCAVDLDVAAQLRAAGVAVLEGTRSGLVALRHLLAYPLVRTAGDAPVVDAQRQRRWRDRLADPQPVDGVESFRLLEDYGIAAGAVRAADTSVQAVAAAQQLGFPVVLKTAAHGVAHKSDAGGVLLDVADPAGVEAGFRQLAAAFDAGVLVCATAPAGIEVSVGLVSDPVVGPMVVIAAGGVLVELLGDRVVALPPISPAAARGMIDRLRIRPLLAGYRGAPGGDVDALGRTVTALSTLACELGDALAALDVNPVIVSDSGAVAVDALVVAGGGTAERR